MISVIDAEKIIKNNVLDFSIEECSLTEASGRVLREDIYADRDQPPYDRVAMDGIAVNLESWKDDDVNRFFIEGIEQAGQTPIILKDKTSCIEVMTGAVLPKGCDCVIPVENISVEADHAVIRKGMRFNPMQNVHHQGADYPKETLLINKGSVLKPPHVAVLAAVGKTEVKVSQQPKIAVFTTGNELVDIYETPEEHQVRRSNSYAVRAALFSQGFSDVDILHLNDDREEIRKKLESTLDVYDIHILSGGVSMGRYDLLPEVLLALGVDVLFHRVAMRPGKPFWFGKTKDNRPVFALPGNPVSTLTCFYRFVLPYIKQASGLKNCPKEFVTLSEDFYVKTTLTYFLPVKIQNVNDGKCLAQPVPPNGSGDFVSLAKSDGFIELQENVKDFQKGYSAPYFSW